MYYHILKFSTPQVSCMSCVNSIRSQISQTFNRRFASFELLEYFESDLENKNIRLKIAVNEENLNLKEAAQILIDNFALEEIGQEIQWLDDAKDNGRTVEIFMSFSLAFFWLLTSLHVLILSANISALAICFSIVGMAWLSKGFCKHAYLQFYAGWKDKSLPLFNMDTLFILTGIIVVLSSFIGIFFAVFPNLLETGFLIFGFRHLGITFQAYLDKKMGFSRSLVELFKNRQYFCLENGQYVLTKELKIGDQIKVQKGDIFPVDGILISKTQNLEIRDMLDTGSYLSFGTDQESIILAGSECIAGECVFKVTHEIENSRFGRIDQSIFDIDLSIQKTILKNQVDIWMQWFIPSVLVISVTSFAIVSQFYPLSMAINCAISVLVSACPCTLGLIIPMALRMGAYKSSASQVFFQSSDALEKAAKAEILVMDYNGTLTQGQISVEAFLLLDQNYSQTFIDQVIYTIEHEMLTNRPEHPIGRKILDKVSSRSKPIILDGLCEDLGFGGSLILEQEKWWLGNNQLIKHLKISDVEPVLHRIYLFCQKTDVSPIQMIGYMNCYDPLKQDAKQFVSEMLQQGKLIRICTGADEKTAQLIAEQLSIKPSLISCNNRMADKRLFFQNLKREFPKRSVVMIGDAINDKEAFQECDLSIFLQNYNNIGFLHSSLKKSADILVLSNQLMHMSYSFKIAQVTMSIIYQNLILSLLYNIFTLLLAGGVFLTYGVSLPPVVGVLLMIFQSFFLTLNAYRLMFTNENQSDNTDFEKRNALTPT